MRHPVPPHEVSRTNKGDIMQEVTLDTLAQRLNRLEREVRHWRLGATMLLTCAVAALVMGQTIPKPQVIEAQRFILKSPDGTVRAILGQHDSTRKAPPGGELQDSTKTSGLGKSWGLHIFGSEGEYDAGLMSEYMTDGGYLMLANQTTASDASLSVGSGYVSLLLRATKQSPEARARQVGEYHKKQQAAKTPQEKEEALAIAPFPEIDSTAHIFVRASKDTPTALTLGEKGGSEVVLGHVEMLKPYGVVEQRPLSSLVFFGKDGKVIWKAP